MNADPVCVEVPEDGVRRLIQIAREEKDSDVYFGKRRWTRYGLQVKMDVTTDPEDRDECFPGVTHNISGGGIGLWTKRQLKPDTIIYVRPYTQSGIGQWIRAVVSHCTLGIQGYLVGATFADPLEAEADPGKQEQATVLDPGERAAAATPEERRLRSRFCGMSLRARYRLVCAASACIGALLGAWLSIAFWPHPWSGWLGLTAGLVSGAIGALAGWLVIGPQIRFVNDILTAIRLMIKGDQIGPALFRHAGDEWTRLSDALLDLQRMLRSREQQERAHREKLEELNRIKNNFLSIVSHDLRTPLTSILLYARMLMDQLNDLGEQDQNRFLAIIADECGRLSRLVDDLLDVQRLEMDRVEWNIQPADLAKVIRTSVCVFEAMAQSKSITLKVACAEALPPVNMDPEKIAQVVSNLLSNAVKYTPAGGSVDVSVEPLGHEVLVRVRDTGPGIPRDKWDKIFDRFSRLSDTSVCEYGGVGLGLYIVKWIVERHGGAVWVDSEVGKGSEFCFSLAACSVTPGNRMARTADPMRRAVVCDAAPEVVGMVSQILRTKGFEVRPAYSAARLLAHLGEWKPEIVVTDLHLPDMPAPALLQKLSGHPLRRSFQLLVHSHVNGPSLVKVPGVDVLLLRPVSKDALLQAVDFARQRLAGKGQVVLVVSQVGEAADRLLRSLSQAGHVAMAVATVADAQRCVQRYGVDHILVFDDCLSGSWPEIRLLQVEGSTARVAVLSQAAGSEERQLAQEANVDLVPYVPDGQVDGIESMLCQAAQGQEVMTA
jgi:signal transduction histidine kinase/CheY-like chemotaxis protein